MHLESLKVGGYDLLPLGPLLFGRWPNDVLRAADDVVELQEPPHDLELIGLVGRLTALLEQFAQFALQPDDFGFLGSSLLFQPIGIDQARPVVGAHFNGSQKCIF